MLTTSLRNLARAAVLASALATLAAPAPAAETLGSHAYWTSLVSGSGSERLCGVRTAMSRGGSVALFVAGGKVHLALTDPRWRLGAQAEEIGLRILVDGEGFSGTGRAKADMVLVEDLSGSFLAAFVAGRRMEIRLPSFVMGGVQWTVDLRGSRAATRDMIGCVRGSRGI